MSGKGQEARRRTRYLCVMCVNKQQQIELDSRMLGQGKMRARYWCLWDKKEKEKEKAKKGKRERRGRKGEFLNANSTEHMWHPPHIQHKLL